MCDLLEQVGDDPEKLMDAYAQFLVEWWYPDFNGGPPVGYTYGRLFKVVMNWCVPRRVYSCVTKVQVSATGIPNEHRSRVVVADV